jgi:hypothetical protein
MRVFFENEISHKEKVLKICHVIFEWQLIQLDVELLKLIKRSCLSITSSKLFLDSSKTRLNGNAP